MLIQLQPYDWTFIDPNIYIWGLNKDNKSVLVIINQAPIFCYFDVEATNIYLVAAWLNKFKEEVKKVSVVNRYPLYYYHPKPKPYIFVSFNTYKHMVKIVDYVANITHIDNMPVKIVACEDWVNPILSFTTLVNINMAEWIEIDCEPVIKRCSSCEYEYLGKWKSIKKLNIDTVSKPIVMAFDIEAYSDDDRTFTNPLLSKHVVFMVSMVTHNKRYLITTTQCSDIEGVDIYRVKDEVELCYKFQELMILIDPDVVIGFNTMGYDYEYLYTRLARRNHVWGRLGRLLFESTKLIYQHGKQQNFKYLYMPGRINLDLLSIVRREYNFAKYDLNTVAKEIIGKTKHDIKAKEMFKMYRNGEDMVRVGKYCVEDSVLLLELYDKMNLWIGLVEMANIVGVSIQDLYIKGQQVRCVSQIYRECFNRYVINKRIEQPIEYKGGFVFEPKPGKHNHVICLDFKSMYPSIIQAYNICFTTFINNADIEDSKCHIIEWDNYRYRFIKEPRGILPNLVKRLVDDRNRVRKQRTDDPVMQTVLDKRQLALKISANALYGFLGVQGEKAILPFVEGAMSITAMGRMLIKRCQLYIEDKYKANVIYGDTDSIMFNLPSSTSFSYVFEYGKRIQEDINNMLPKPLSTDFEKAGKILCIKKKHYAFWVADEKGLKYKEYRYIIDSNSGQKIRVKEGGIVERIPDMIYRGILLSRRDNCPWQKKVYRDVLYMIMEDKPIYDTFNYIVDTIHNLFHGKVSINDLIQIRQIGSNYKSDTFYLKVFADRLGLKSGDRVEYLICNVDNDKLGFKMCPLDMYDHQPIDYVYYANLIQKPIDNLFYISYKDEVDKIVAEDERKFVDKYRQYGDTLDKLYYHSDNKIRSMIRNHYNRYMSEIRISPTPIKNLLKLYNK
jgi:DNA polymerase delta subunit 1